MASQQQKIQHLFLRAAFGETPDVVKAHLNTPLSAIVEELFESSKGYKDMFYLPYPLNEKEERKGVGAVQIVKMILQSKKDSEELNLEWIFKMAYTPAQVREKMTFFWHNHFSTSVPFSYLMQMQNNMIRRNALGKFGDLLHAVAKDPAMIIYLNNQQNKKDHPNENFAREVMELFTLGEGHYTEHDIKEAARAFTGWSVNTKGQFEFHENDHDSGEKVFMNKKGNFNGDEIIDIILENKQTAVYLVTKIYREFVNDNVNSQRVKELADSFYQTGYDIGALMKQIFTSAWFYEDENIGCKIASPVELIVRYKKLLDLEFEKNKTVLDLQYVLGQVLFFPPNVAGWKGGSHWIDSSTILIRLSIPQYILTNAAMELQSKPAYEEAPLDGYHKKEIGKIKSDWSKLTNSFKNHSADELETVLLESFIQCDAGRIDRELVMRNTDNSTDDKKIISMVANIMSLPEFQLI